MEGVSCGAQQNTLFRTPERYAPGLPSVWTAWLLWWAIWEAQLAPSLVVWEAVPRGQLPSVGGWGLVLAWLAAW